MGEAQEELGALAEVWGFFVLFCGASLEVLVPSSVCLEGHRGSVLGWRRKGRERQVIQISSSFSELFVN